MSVSRVGGILAPYAPGFRARLAERGYRPATVEDQVWLMAHLSRWLAEHDLEPSAFTAKAAESFRRAHRERYSHLTGARGLDALLGYLRDAGVVPEPERVDSPAGRLLAEYRSYLIHERGLVPGSVQLRERVARVFLAELLEPLDVALTRLEARHVAAFVASQCRDGRRGVAASKTLTSGLRALLVFLHVSGRIGAPLAGAVPRVAGWRLSALPRGLEQDHVAALLHAYDRSTPIGRRDYAMLMLLARLGLRACEVARLRVDDINWRVGELTVRGKGAQFDQLPLPHDVGAALVEHLNGRPRGEELREVFLRTLAPHGPLSAHSIDAVVRHACQRAGVPAVGTHRLRHTVASELLGQGASLAEIAPVLRHANLSTTAIYAKVDRIALRTLARPWPIAGATA